MITIQHQGAMEGMDRAIRNTPPGWRQAAIEAVCKYDEKKYFTAWDVRRWALRKKLVAPLTHHNCAWGTIFNLCAKAKYIKKIDLTRSTAPLSHGAYHHRWQHV